MPTFRFSLEPVLSYKRSQEEMLQFELAQLQQQAQQARAVRDALNRELEKRRADLRSLMGNGRLNVDEVMQYERFLHRLTQRLHDQEALVAQLEAQVAAKRDELLQVRQEETMLETLKERQFQRFQQELERVAMQLIDESAIARFNRRRTEEGL